MHKVTKEECKETYALMNWICWINFMQTESFSICISELRKEFERVREGVMVIIWNKTRKCWLWLFNNSITILLSVFTLIIKITRIYFQIKWKEWLDLWNNLNENWDLENHMRVSIFGGDNIHLLHIRTTYTHTHIRDTCQIVFIKICCWIIFDIFKQSTGQRQLQLAGSTLHIFQKPNSFECIWFNRFLIAEFFDWNLGIYFDITVRWIERWQYWNEIANKENIHNENPELKLNTK